MINFAEETLFKLSPINEKDIPNGIDRLFVPGEVLVGAFRTVRDQVIFTSRRVITVDIQGLTGLKKDFVTIPYSRIQYFSVQTPGFAEIISDGELQLFFADGFVARFQFSGESDIVKIGRTISEYTLR